MKKFVDETRLQKLCKLAMLDVKEEEVARYLDLMNSSLETLEALDDINVDGLKELTNPYDMALIEYPDVVSDGDKVELLMKSAPTSLYNYFVVPKVMEKK
ncbi:MAG TPA: Asp-tRNA(Asn)/Glu-tRNA(Gln) amidotransferase subunit GatC [Rickettsiales bacterium]|nr:Asp-tRNA(Asn)/Glu-tRNA(Gln) amidotransferase subunit GatC [Rickettsiales bacterium]